MDEMAVLPNAYWEGSGHNVEMACTLASIGQVESSQKVRAWYPHVKPNMDTMGTHNDCLCLELYREGLITDSKRWRNSHQWAKYRRIMQSRPDFGTLIASKAFVRLSNKFGQENAIQMWKTGHVGTVPGLEYLMQIKAIKAKMIAMCRR